jgi:hypothetical protein
VLQFSPGNGSKKAKMPVLSSSIKTPTGKDKEDICFQSDDDEDVSLFDPREASMSLDDGEVSIRSNTSSMSRKSLAGTPPWAVKDQTTPPSKKGVVA